MIGIASSRSSALPWGIPSTTSTRTRSASSRSASQCAVVAPVMPAPMIEILFMTPPGIDVHVTKFYPKLMSEKSTFCHLLYYQKLDKNSGAFSVTVPFLLIRFRHASGRCDGGFLGCFEEARRLDGGRGSHPCRSDHL